MKISSLELVNFRSHERTKFALADRTYIVGHNNAGKTTVIDALQWALTGGCSGLDGASREIAELIREQVRDDGEAANPQGLGVKVTIDDFGAVQRQTDGRNVFLKVKDWSGSNKAQQEQLFEKLGLTDAIISACMNTGAFLALHHAEAKSLIFGVLDVRIPAEPLEKLGIAGPLSLDELDRHYKVKFEKRADVKRDLQAHQVPPAPADLGDDVPTVDELQAQLDELRAEERELIGSTSEARGRKNAITQQIAELSAEKVTIEKRIQAAGDPHAELDKAENALCLLDSEAPEAPAEDGPELAEDPEAEAQFQEADAIRVKLADDKGRLRMIAEAVDGIANHKPDKGCVLDNSIPCQTPAKEFKGKLKAIRSEIEQLGKTIEEQGARLDWLNAEASGREERLRAESEQKHAAERTYTRTRQGLTDKIRDLNARIRNKQNDDERLEEVLGAIARLSSDLSNLADVEEPEGLAELQDRLRKGEQMVAEVRAYWTAKTAHENAAAMHAKLEERVKVLEHAVEQLGPKGLMLEVLENARRLFEDRVNASLEKWGYALAFQLDPWTVRVNGRKSNQLSKSERLRVGIALQLAIAEITGLWFVAIDEADMLDSKQRDIFQEVIEDWRGQILIAATKDPDFEVPTEPIDGLAVYQLELRDHVTTVHA